MEHGSSNFGGGAATFLQLLDYFLFNVLGGFNHNLTSGMNGICSPSFATMVYGGTYAVVSSIMGVGEGVSTPDSTIVLVLE